MDSTKNEAQVDISQSGFRTKEMVKRMIFYGSPILVQFPREEKYLLAKRIRETMYEMLHICNEIEKKYYKRDTLRQLDVKLQDLRDYLELAASPKLYPQGTERKKKRKKQSGEAAPQVPPQPVTCITSHQYEVWSTYTGAIGGMIGNYLQRIDGKYVEGKKSK